MDKNDDNVQLGAVPLSCFAIFELKNLSESFAEGSVRIAYMMKDLSLPAPKNHFVCKMAKEGKDNRKQYFDDVVMQMEAKKCKSKNIYPFLNSFPFHRFAKLFNEKNPPKKVEFLDAFIVELIER